ncbi:Protein kinase alk2 [Naganishia albida]|nr:Protein kinase alk2 [Naganishia albida]
MQYSPFLAAAVVRNILTPLILISLPTLLLNITIARSTRLLVHLAALVFNYSLLSSLSLIRQQWVARRLHAQAVPVPRVRGRWPLNLDVMVDWMRSSKGEYLGEGMIAKLEQTYGKTMNTRVLGEDSIITTSAVHIAHILGPAFTAFDKGPKWKERVDEMIGDGVFGSDGDLWRFHRATTRPFFTRSRLSLCKILEPHTSTYISHITRLFPSPSPSPDSDPRPFAFDMQELTRRLTLDVAMSWACGHSTGLLDDPASVRGGRGEEVPRGAKAEGVKVFEAFAEAQAVASMRIKIGTLWSLFEWRENKMKAPMQTIRGFIRPIVADAVRIAESHRPARSTDGHPRNNETLLDFLAQSLDDPKTIEDEIINILVAASDTTASAITSCAYCLAMYPECMTMIAREIETLSLQGMTADALSDFQYLNAFVHEVLRLYPPVPLNIRRSNRDVLLPPLDSTSAPLVFPAHTSVILSTLSVQRDKDVWGPDAEAFDPSRWLNSDPRSQKGYPFGPPGFGKAAFPAFHLGPRSCLGQTFALQQLAYTVAQLVKSLRPCEPGSVAYRLSLAPEAQPNGTDVPVRWKTLRGRGAQEGAYWSNNLTLYFKGGLWLKVEADGKG